MGESEEMHWSEVYDKLQECKTNLKVALDKRNYWFQQYLLFKDSAEAFAGRIAQLERQVNSLGKELGERTAEVGELKEKIREQQVIIEDYADIDRLGADNG